MTTEATPRTGLKRLVFDLVMAAVFLGLVLTAAWIAWVFYVRGPIQLETRGFVSRTVAGEPAQPSEVEKYTLGHFHNLDEAAVTGIAYESVCVTCHGDYAHSESEKTRALLNAHSWFIACEVCHSRPGDGEIFVYQWLDNRTDRPLTELRGRAGAYGGRITPMRLVSGVPTRIEDAGEQAFAERYSRTKDNLDEQSKDIGRERIHRGVTESAVTCDDCHRERGVIDFAKLLYPRVTALELESIDVGAMVKAYSDFHMPGLFDPRSPSHRADD